MLEQNITRRTALKATALTAAPFVLPSRIFGAVAPSDKVNFCVIGLGGRSQWLVEEILTFMPEANISGLCDIFQPRLGVFDNLFKNDTFNANWNTYTRFEEMLEKEKPDGVFIETTTHARAWLAIEIMKRGFDVYIEKPMCLTVEEGRAMVDAAKKFKVVTQVGTQQRSQPLTSWASRLIREGIIGKVRAVLAPNFIGPQDWSDRAGQGMPDGGSDDWWDVWTNQAPMRPYHDQLHRAWARWSAYDAGGLSFGVSGWGAHSYDQVQCGLGTDDTTPTEIVLQEKPAKLRAKVLMRYADGIELRLHLNRDWGPGLGCIFAGDDGKMEVNRGKITASPKEMLDREDRPNPMRGALPGRTVSEDSIPHVRNWVACMESRQKCNADIETGLRAATVCNLVNVAREVGEVGQTLKWDPVAEQFTNHDDANKNRWVARPRRKGWELVF